MRRLLLTLILLLAPGSVLFAQSAGVVGLYADQEAINCNVVDDTPGLLTIWVVHTNTAGARGIQFSAPMPSCMVGAVYLSDTLEHTWYNCGIGDSQTGIACSYGDCVGSPIVVLGINLYTNGSSTVCCEYPMGTVEIVDCSGSTLFPGSHSAIINGDSSCPCVSPVPVETSTWGKVKALYVE